MNGIKCIINCGNNRAPLIWYYDKSKNSDESINYTNFMTFLSNQLNTDPKCMKIYYFENGAKSKNKNDGELVEDEGDFGSYFEDINVGSGKTVYFFNQLLAGKKISVDLQAGECKENLNFTIAAPNFNNETEWMESWEETLNQISTKLKNKEWEKEFVLIHKASGAAVNKKLNDFINVFKNSARNKNNNVEEFYLRV